MEVSGNTSEKLLELGLLTIILVTAACARFYSLDLEALSAGELSNLAVCDVSGWYAMVVQFAGNSGMPPVYPTLLCQFTAWTSNAEFFVRAVSSLAGVVSVYIVYLFGKHFFSATNGLLAAAVAATSFQIILVDREATLNALLALGMLIHSYCFCRLLMLENTPTSQSIDMDIKEAGWSLQWSWKPNFVCDARFLLGFWISGALVFYTSPVSLILLITELMASVFLVAANSRSKVLRALWLPILIMMLPWMPTLYGLSKWILEGHLFGLQSLAGMTGKLHNLSPVDPAFLKIYCGLATISAVLIGIMLLKKQYRLPQKQFLYFLGLQFLTALLAIGLISVSAAQSYMYLLILALIIVVEPISFLIEKYSISNLRNGLLMLVVLAIISSQIASNKRYKIYKINGYNGFELTARIIRDDQSFMKGNKMVFTSKGFPKYYLEKYGVISSSDYFHSEDMAEKIHNSMESKEFYYLEYSGADRGFSLEHPVFRQLTEKYKILCMTKGGGFRVTKFSGEPPQNETAPECRVRLSGAMELQ